LVKFRLEKILECTLAWSIDVVDDYSLNSGFGEYQDFIIVELDCRVESCYNTNRLNLTKISKTYDIHDKI
jgi:hypothetical protein